MTQGQINLEEMFASSVVARSVREGTSCDDYITLLSWWLMTRYGRTTRANCGLSSALLPASDDIDSRNTIR